MTKFTKEEIEMIRKLAKEQYKALTGRNADDDPNWWDVVKRDEEEREARIRKHWRETGRPLV